MIDAARTTPVVCGLFIVATFAGCTAPGFDAPCDARTLLSDALGYFDAVAASGGGFAAASTAAPDGRTTAWVLLAAGLARRTGLEGAFDAEPHIVYLRTQLGGMLAEGRSIDSAANNLSLARAALQVWGRSASGITLGGDDATTLADAWAGRFNATTGAYGTRLNEHLFAAFAAWIFGPPGPLRDALSAHVADLAAGDHTIFDHDAWFAGYARLALGPAPRQAALAAHLDAVLDERQAAGGVHGFADATRPDASSTAAALLAWGIAGEGLDGAHTRPAITYLCSIQRADGAVPFSGTRDVARVKTTAEATIALALLVQPIPWSDGDARS